MAELAKFTKSNCYLTSKLIVCVAAQKKTLDKNSLCVRIIDFMAIWTDAQIIGDILEGPLSSCEVLGYFAN